MSFSKEKRNAIKEYILNHISTGAEASQVVKKAEEAFHISGNTVYRYLHELSDDRVITRKGKSYCLNGVTHIYRIPLFQEERVEEDDIYARYFMAEIKDLPDNVQHIWAYSFSEMMNNAIDHAKASEVLLYINRNYLNTTVIIDDNGVGIFQNIRNYYHFGSIEDAIIELFKGKLTTDKAHHSGEGIFFTSRMMDLFAAISDGKMFTHSEYSEVIKDLEELPSLNRSQLFQKGTAILMRLSNQSRKTAKEIMDQYADVDGGFTRTRIPIKNLFPSWPVSRSQAKRLSARLESFEEVELDFKDVAEIGQGFAHELFVVFQNQHPEVKLIPFNASLDVERMIYHVKNSA